MTSSSTKDGYESSKFYPFTVFQLNGVFLLEDSTFGDFRTMVARYISFDHVSQKQKWSPRDLASREVKVVERCFCKSLFTQYVFAHQYWVL